MPRSSDSKDANDVAKEANRIARFAIIFTLVTIILSVGFYCDTRNREENRDLHEAKKDARINELSYQVNATQFRPTLKIMEAPAVEMLNVFAEKVPSKNPNVLMLVVSFELAAMFKMANVGNAIAHVSAIAWGDTTSGQSTLEKKMIRNPASFQIDSSQYYDPPVLFPNDAEPLFRRYRVQFISDDSFTLHLLLIYQNEAGASYYTYYWARYRIDRPDSTFFPIFGENAVKIGTTRKKFKEHLVLIDTHISTKVYSQEELKKLEDFVMR